MSNPIIWIASRGLISSLRGGVGLSLSIAYVSACAVYTFSLYPYFIDGEPSLRPMFEFIPFLLTLLAPTLTLDIIAADRQNRQLDVWLATPISYPSLLLGKLGGAWLLFMLATSVSLCIPLLLSQYVSLHWPSILTGYLGVALLGTMYLCIGLWSSVRANNPLSAWLSSFSICFLFYLIGVSARFLPPSLAEWSQLLSTQVHFERLTIGMIDTRDLIYFFGMILYWFTLAVETLRHQVNETIRIKKREQTI